MKPTVMNWLFSTPVAVFDLFDFVTEEVNSTLQKIGYTTNELVDGIRGDSDPSKLEPLQPLYEAFQTCVDQFSKEIGIRNSKIFESWMNILGLNGSVGTHRHFGSVISGAYYPYVDKGSAPIMFINSVDGYRMIDVNAAISDYGTPYNSNIFSVQAVTGQLVLFPSWVQHYVPPNKTNMRITLSFNTKF